MQNILIHMEQFTDVEANEDTDSYDVRAIVIDQGGDSIVMDVEAAQKLAMWIMAREAK